MRDQACIKAWSLFIQNPFHLLFLRTNPESKARCIMGIFIITCKALLIYLITLAGRRTKTLALKDANLRLSTQQELRRLETLQLRQRRRLLQEATVRPEHYISEYIDSLLCSQALLAGTTTQVDHWVKPQISKTSKPYPSNPAPQSIADDEDWIHIDSEVSTCQLKVAS